MNEEHSLMVPIPVLPAAWEPFQSQEKTAPAIKADLAKRAAPVITADQMELICSTVAKDATPDELKLYLFDCQRQGVHPLDKLIHFTVRTNAKGQRRYTPVTSIDFMRIRAAETGEYAGSDDATHGDLEGPLEHPHPVSATVTVWRLVQGQRCSFTATARWSEYKPDQNAFMWSKMPFTMLAKCAEALALRKGFPRQLAGLYAKEEMDQAGSGQAVPAIADVSTGAPRRKGQPRSEPPSQERTSPAHSDVTTGPAFQPPDAQDDPTSAYVVALNELKGSGAKGEVTLASGEVLRFYNAGLFPILLQARTHHLRVELERKTSAAGKTYLVKAQLLEQPKDIDGAF